MYEKSQAQDNYIMKNSAARMVCFYLIFIVYSIPLGANSTADADDNIDFKPEGEQLVWIYLKASTFQKNRIGAIQYPEHTRTRLQKVNWDRSHRCDYRLDPKIRSALRENVKHLRYYARSLGAVSARISAQNYQALKNLTYIDRIEPLKRLIRRTEPRKVQPTGVPGGVAKQGDYGNTFTQLNQIQITVAHAAGYTGRGVRIAILDTGFDWEHPVFEPIVSEGRLISARDFIFNDQQVEDESVRDTTVRGNQSHHGTAVWSVLGGYLPRKLIGAAYNAEFLLAKTERLGSETRIEEDYYVAAVEWADSMGADIISSSLGYRDFDDFEYPYIDLDGKTAVTSRAVNWAFERGVLVVTAAGNDAQHFSDGGILTPADAFGALAAGAVDSKGNIASFSSHGPTSDGRIKPDLCAMGVTVFYAYDHTDTSFAFGNGTSFATPLIAGSAALILEKFPSWTPGEVIQALKASASRADNPSNLYGWGIPDIWHTLRKGDSLWYYDVAISASGITVFPNPARGQVYFLFESPLYLHTQQKAALSVFDLAGQQVFYRTADLNVPGVKELFSWDLTDFAGQPLPAGLYLVLLQQGHQYKKAKMTVLH